MYDYIKRAYGVNPVVGQQVRHTVTHKLGTIARENRGHGHYVNVRFDGAKLPLLCHPTELEYLS